MSCQTLSGTSQIITLLSTSIGSTIVTLTGEPQTITTSSASLITSCPAATACAGNGTVCGGTPACVTSTTFLPVTSTIAGIISSSTSFITDVETSFSTSFGPSITSCVSTSTQASTSASVGRPTTTTAPPTTTPTSSTFATSFQSSSLSTTPVPTTTSSSAAAVVDHSSSAAGAVTTTSAPNALLTSSANGDVYSTIITYEIVTVTGNDGQVSTQTSMISIPTLLHNGKGSSSKASKGAIAGGIVGGILAVFLALGFIWVLKRRGVFARDGGDQFTDDMWRPSPHGPGVVGGPRQSLEEDDNGEGNSSGEGGLMSEKGAPSLLARQSWYGGSGGAEQPRHSRRESNPSYYGDNQSMSDHGGAAEMMGGASLSHRRSMTSHQSHSSHGHDRYYPNSPAAYAPSLPDPRQQFYQSALPPISQPGPREDDEHEEIQFEGAEVSRSTSNASSRSESARTAATSGSSVGYSRRPMLGLTPLPVRPPLQPTADLNSSSTNNSTEPLHPSSSLFSIRTESTGQTTLPPSPSSPTRNLNTLPVRKRPYALMTRSNSDDSFLHPSQFLGARIANRDESPGEEKDSLDLTSTVMVEH